MKVLLVAVLFFVMDVSLAGDEFNARYCLPESNKVTSDKLTNDVNEFIEKQNKKDPFKEVTPFDGECLIALYGFFDKINLAKNKGVHFNIKNYRSASCFRSQNITNLYLQPISIVCNKKHDVRQMGYKAFKIILNNESPKQNSDQFCEQDRQISNNFVCHLCQRR